MGPLRDSTVRLTRVSALLASLAGGTPRAEAAPPEPVPASPETSGAPTEPPKGNHMLGLGIASISLGVLNIGYGVPLAVVCPADACFPGTIGISLGTVFLTAGAITTHFGRKRRAVYRGWREATGLAEQERQRRLRNGPEPPSGVGLLVGGSLSVVAGASGLVWGVGQDGIYDYEVNELIRYPPGAQASLTLGALGIAGGAVMLGFGGAFARKHRRWDRGEFARITPAPMWLPDGAGFSVIGRF
jgi:hypothetical protein